MQTNIYLKLDNHASIQALPRPIEILNCTRRRCNNIRCAVQRSKAQRTGPYMEHTPIKVHSQIITGNTVHEAHILR